MDLVNLSIVLACALLAGPSVTPSPDTTQPATSSAATPMTCYVYRTDTGELSCHAIVYESSENPTGVTTGTNTAVIWLPGIPPKDLQDSSNAYRYTILSGRLSPFTPDASAAAENKRLLYQRLSLYPKLLALREELAQNPADSAILNQMIKDTQAAIDALRPKP